MIFDGPVEARAQNATKPGVRLNGVRFSSVNPFGVTGEKSGKLDRLSHRNE